MLTAEQRDTIRAARDAEARARAKRTRRVEDQLERDLQQMEAEVTQETPQATEPSENGSAPEWTRETILEAMLRWHANHGSLPGSSDWQRRKEGYPTYDAVRKFFEGWPDAIAAAANAMDAERAEDSPASLDGPEASLVGAGATGCRNPMTGESIPDSEFNELMGVDPTVKPPAPVASGLALLAAEYEAAHRAVEEAEARYQEVLGRFRAHPLVDLALAE